MALNNFTEDRLGMSTSNAASLAKSFDNMKKSLSAFGLDPFLNVNDICRDATKIKALTESIKLNAATSANVNRYQAEDMQRLNAMYDNVATELLNESIATVGNLSPIAINSFGIQERALISAHLPRAVKQVVAKVPDFKLTERIPFIIDLAGNKRRFIDAFTPDANGEYPTLALDDTVMFDFPVPANNIDLYEGSDTSIADDDPGYRPAVDTKHVFGFNSVLDSVSITVDQTAHDGYALKANSVRFGIGSTRTPNVENGTLAAVVNWTIAKSGSPDIACSATISAQFDLSNGKLVYIATTDPQIKYAKFKMVLSPETHIKAITVGYDMKHTPVSIPVGQHFEYSLTEEFRDATEKYYNTDAMAMLTDYMGKAIEQFKDIATLKKFQELGNSAIVQTTFNCTPSTGFAQGKEEYIRREFHPFMEKVCILLKNKTRIANCHFRVVGNPLDIRLPASGGIEYIYKRNEEFAGEIAIDYEFSVTSDVHKIFYLSSERVPAGTLYVFLIPNSIENNISTVNHYEYATYVSNKYRGTNSNAPTVMISTRYLTQEYYPVVAKITIVNNLVDDSNTTTASGTGLSDALYSKVNYVNG